MWTDLSTTRRLTMLAMALGIVAVFLPLLVSLTPEMALAAHLIGLMIVAVTAKALWFSSRGDGVLLTGAGALGAAVPVLAWQMPAGGAWVLTLLGVVTLSIGLRHALRHDFARDRTDAACASGSGKT